ncbi:hypothetical protein [Halococcus agarilyticus]|uniref:hypothetical protein n=1 Tax=Halococcus agarilyticus TaxID=1232219 RepID=UPI0006776121|nr:hypothetical protein [Halococcus agarilyticus]
MAYIPDDTEEWPASVLTPNQRERIAEGSLDPSVAADRAMLARIRKRIQVGIFDLGALSRGLQQKEIQKAFKDPDDRVYQPIGSTIPDALALFYLAGWEQETAPNTSEGWYFEGRIEGAIERALNARGITAEDVTVNIDVERGDPIDDLARGELRDLPSPVLSQLFANGAISHEEFTEATEPPARGPEEQDDKGS